MMKNIEIIINKENRMVDLKKSSIGNDGENLQYNLVFSFLNGFVDGQARLEYQISGEKYFAILEKHEETYTMPINSLLTKVGKILMQIVITQGTSEEEVPIFKSNVFYMFCNSSINAQTQEPDGYVEWLDIANTKLNELDNINIEATKENGVVTITITNKDGSKESVNLYDAEGAITNYEMLDNKPKINGVELVGDKTLEELGIQEKGNYLTSENDPLFKQSASYGITSQDITNWNNKSDFNGNYDDLNGKPTIPTKTSDLTNDSSFASESYVTNAIENAQLGGEIDLSGYATKDELNAKVDKVSGKSLIADSEIERLSSVTNYDDTGIKNILNSKANTSDIPTKVSQLSNDNGYLTKVPSEYITETELNNKGYLTEHQDISNLATKSELHFHSNKTILDDITQEKINTWDAKSNFSGSYNDLSDKPSVPSNLKNGASDSSVVLNGADTSSGIGQGALALGYYCKSTAFGAVSVGRSSKALGRCSIAIGETAEASGDSSFATGYETKASGKYTHAEGQYSKATQLYSHAEGQSTTASGTHSHAEGCSTLADGSQSHSEGYGTIANGECQHVQGKYNIADTKDKYGHIVGN